MSTPERRVEPDEVVTPKINQWEGEPYAVYYRSTILRVIDEEIAEWGREIGPHDAMEYILRTLRTRFEPDTQGGDR